MKKIYIILIILAILVTGGILTLNYLDAEFNQEWRSCETDDNCLLVPSYSACPCGDTAINKIFKDDYDSFLARVKIFNKLAYSKILCERCAPLFNPVAKCENNICVARSS